MTSVGCSLGRILLGDPTPVPTLEAPTPLPTWTPSPEGQLSPAEIATMTVVAGISWPTLTPTFTPAIPPTQTPTFTPALPPTPMPTPTPEAYVVIKAPIVNVREGPSIAYPIVGQVNQGEQYTLIGRNDASTWWKICCFSGREVWITAQLTTPGGSLNSVPVASAPPPPPTAFPTSTPLPTNTPRPAYPFDVGDGPHFFESNNPWLTIFVKAFTGLPPIFLPVPGYRLRVLRNGVDVSESDVTRGVFELSAPFLEDDPDAFGSRREYNLKYEFFPDAGEASWTIYMTDGSGAQLSPEVTFDTHATGGVREVYVGFFDLR
ncbi:MAG: SH3 domain-containing protein [Chloroflexota bacterium]|nr:SH3 domain-containing protein [Chloroflexota bacterium]